MAKKANKVENEDLNIDSILFKCRDILRAAKNSGSFFEKRDMMLTLIFLRFMGEKYEDGLERYKADLTVDPVSDDLPEVFFNIPADDKHNFIESRLNGVVNGIVHDDMTGFVHLGQLLDPAPIAAADPGCHDNQSCLFQRGVLLFAQTKNRQGFFFRIPCYRIFFNKNPQIVFPVPCCSAGPESTGTAADTASGPDPPDSGIPATPSSSAGRAGWFCG